MFELKLLIDHHIPLLYTYMQAAAILTNFTPAQHYVGMTQFPSPPPVQAKHTDCLDARDREGSRHLMGMGKGESSSHHGQGKVPGWHEL